MDRAAEEGASERPHPAARSGLESIGLRGSDAAKGDTTLAAPAQAARETLVRSTAGFGPIAAIMDVILAPRRRFDVLIGAECCSAAFH